jgi:DNA-directed RNA polymerase II subunit RPB1
MVALLGQQLIEGKRVQYTLQDRTLPHFARYDDGVESRGFVQHSFVDGLMPAEFFYHAQAGREGLIDTAVKTSDTGYIQRRLMKSMEDQHVEHDGTVRNVTGSVIQFNYGEDGVDTVSVESQTCELPLMALENIYREYALSLDDVNPFLVTAVEDAPDMVEDIIADRDMFVKSVFRYRKNDTVLAPVNLKRLLTKYSNSYSTKTDLTPTHVVSAITRFVKEFPYNKVFHALLRFYLAPKKAIVVHRLSVALFDELMRDIRFRYIKSLVHAGEMVGALAAQSIGEPTTQLTLNTFHSAGTAKANATSGVPRLEEILSASANPKRPGNTVYLNPEFAYDQDAVISKMKEIQRTTLRDITKSVRIYYDPPSNGTVVEEDAEILALYQEFTVANAASCASPWIMRLELNDLEMASRNILDLTEVQAKLRNSPLKILECMHSIGDGKNVKAEAVLSNAEASKLILRLTFDENVVKTPTQLRFLEDKILDTVLTGVDGVGGVHLRKVKNELIYDEKVAGYTQKEQYVLDVDGTNMYQLMVFPGADGTRTFSNDIHEINDVFGIEAARLAIFEECSEVFVQEKVNYHHLSVLVDSMTFSGRIVAVNRFGMNKNETGVLARSSFEETSKNMFNAAMGAEYDTMRGVSANIMFGQKPPCGTGFVDILVDETRLPDGPDEEPEDKTLDEVNRRLEALPETECRLEDILMAW